MKNKITAGTFAFLMIAAFVLTGCSRKLSPEQVEEKTRINFYGNWEADFNGTHGTFEVDSSGWRLSIFRHSEFGTYFTLDGENFIIFGAGENEERKGSAALLGDNTGILTFDENNFSPGAYVIRRSSND